MKQIRKRLTYANVMSLLAVFLILGGGTALALAKNSVGTRELERNAVTRGILARNSVWPGKINLEGVKAGRIAKNAIATDRLRNNVVKTEKIANGAVTSAKVNGSILHTPIRRVEAVSATTNGAGQFRNVTASCPAGERAIAGGGMWTQTDGGPTGFNVLQGSRPVPFTDGTDVITGWQATGISDNAAARQLRAYVICVPA